MQDKLEISSSIKNAIDRNYRPRRIVFNHSIYLCLMFRLDNNIYLIELDDMQFGDMPSLTLRLFDRLDGSVVSNDYIGHNELCFMKMVAAEDLVIPTFERRYTDIDINSLILDPNINNITDQIYCEYMGLETEGDILEMLPKVKC
jgi:hypothetical protein